MKLSSQLCHFFVSYNFSSQSMLRVVQKLKKYSRQEQVLFEKSVRTQGLEACCSRSTVKFSHGEHCQWLKQLHAAHRADLDGKSRALQQLRYTEDSLRRTYSVWEKEPGGMGGNWPKKHATILSLYANILYTQQL